LNWSKIRQKCPKPEKFYEITRGMRDKGMQHREMRRRGKGRWEKDKKDRKIKQSKSGLKDAPVEEVVSKFCSFFYCNCSIIYCNCLLGSVV
jgi:hypothetical protein